MKNAFVIQYQTVWNGKTSFGKIFCSDFHELLAQNYENVYSLTLNVFVYIFENLSKIDRSMLLS